MALPQPFQRRVLDRSGRVARMSDLMRAEAAAEAQGEYAGAMGSAQMWSTLGQTVGQGLTGIADEMRTRPEREFKQQQIDAARKKMGRDAALEDTLQMTGHLSPEDQANEVRAAGFPMEGMTLARGAADLRNNGLRNLYAGLEKTSTAAGRGAYLMEQADKNPSLWPEIHPQLTELAARINPALAEMVPAEYDPAQVSQIVTSAKSLATRQENVMRAAKQLDVALETGKKSAEAIRYGAEILSAGATSPESFAATKEYLRTEVKMPEALLAQYGDFDEDTAERLADLSLTPEQKRKKLEGAAAGSDEDLYQSYAKQFLGGRPWQTMTLDDKLAAKRMEARATWKPKDPSEPDTLSLESKAAAERWRATQLQQLQDRNLPPPEAASMRAEIESSYRRQLGLPPEPSLNTQRPPAGSQPLSERGGDVPPLPTQPVPNGIAPPPAPQAAAPRPGARPPAIRVGEVRTVRGQQMRITKVYPNGQFEAEPVK